MTTTRHWRRALRNLRALFADPDDTERAIEFFFALGSRDFERHFRRFSASARGAALLAERPSLLAALSDRAALSRMGEASLGRAYLAYLDRNGFTPDGLLALNHRVEERWDREAGVARRTGAEAWYSDRCILIHDLSHLLTDYGTDDFGEATLLAFALAQFPGIAQAVLSVGGVLDCAHLTGWRFLFTAGRSWRRGRRAADLVALPWEELLPLRLETVRRLAGVSETAEAHPEGLLRGLVVQRASP
jgi:ubiquinone biosynthesis protein COQ4